MEKGILTLDPIGAMTSSAVTVKRCSDEITKMIQLHNLQKNIRIFFSNFLDFLN